MFTRCPACHTVHPISAAILAQANGRIRCGKCSKSINALDSLFDSWPGAGDRPADNQGDSSSPLVLDAAIKLAESQADSEFDTPAELAIIEKKSRTGLWIAAATILALLTLTNVVTLREVGLAEWPTVQSWLKSVGLIEPAPLPPYSDATQIELISRDMHVHPARRNALILSATMVNRAQQIQAYPVFEVILMDRKSRPIASRRFTPAEYLGPDAHIDGGMTPKAFLAVTLELADPDARAVGFELLFHNAAPQ